MKLVIGGYAQGKLEFVKREHLGESAECVEKLAEEPVIFNHLHTWIRERIADGGCPEEEIKEYIRKNPDCILISDEVGNGIVPMDAFEREYRERCGRILVELAKEADEVERVICGIGQRIK